MKMKSFFSLLCISRSKGADCTLLMCSISPRFRVKRNTKGRCVCVRATEFDRDKSERIRAIGACYPRLEMQCYRGLRCIFDVNKRHHSTLSFMKLDYLFLSFGVNHFFPSLILHFDESCNKPFVTTDWSKNL